jgi:hypothetical protein
VKDNESEECARISHRHRIRFNRKRSGSSRQINAKARTKPVPFARRLTRAKAWRSRRLIAAQAMLN